jgi:hypothetical protein
VIVPTRGALRAILAGQGLSSHVQRRTPTVTRATMLLDRPGLPEPGSTIEQYRIDAVIGRTHLAYLYRVTNLENGAPAILRHYHLPSLLQHEDLAEALRDLQTPGPEHPSIVPLVSLILKGTRACVVAGYAGQPTLADLLAAGPVPTVDLLVMIRDALFGLRALDHIGYAWCDVRPATLVRGMAGWRLLVLGQILALEDDLGEEGFLVGPSGVLPEGAWDGRVSPRQAGFMALGVTVVWAAQGVHPCHAGDAVGVRDRHRAGIDLSGLDRPLQEIAAALLSATDATTHGDLLDRVDMARTSRG